MSTQITISPEIKLVVNTTPITGGSAGQILFQTTGNTVGESASLFWDNATTSLNVIGTTPTVNLNSTSSLTNFSQGFGFSKNGVGIFSFGYTESVSAPRFFIYAATPDRDAIKIYNSTANVAIGNAPSQNTDAGYRLDVNGTFRASDSLIASSSGGGAYKLTVQQTGVSNGNTFRVIQLGYSMIDVNTSGVSFMPFPSPSGTVGITNWTSTGGQTTTFFTKNSEFTPQGGSQAIPLIKFPNPSAPIVMGATATADLRAYLTVSGSFNATLGLGAGQSLLPSLTATANNDALIGLDINPTFTLGAFTNTTRIGARIQNSRFLITGSYTSINTESANPDSLVQLDTTIVGRGGSRAIAFRINPTINVNNVLNQTFSALEVTPTFQNVGAGSSTYAIDSSGPNRFGTQNTFGAQTIFLGQGGTSTYHYVGTIPNGQGFRVQVNGNIAGYSYEFDGSGIPTYTLRNNNIDALQVRSTGNVLINTTTDAGFKLDVNGTARVSGDLSVPTGKITFQTSAFGIDCNTTTGVFDIRNNLGSLQNTRISFSQGTYLNIYQPTQSSTGITSGIINTISTPITYAWSSGTVQSNLFVLNPTINNTGTYNGTFRGFYYNPTLTSLTGTTHYAFHSTSGRVRFEGLPTSSAGLSTGDIWNDGGILKIV